MGSEPMMGATTKIKLTDPNSVAPAATSTPTAGMIPMTNGSSSLFNWINFGDGSDGDVILTASTTLTRDMYYKNLTINTGVVLNTGGYRISVLGTIDGSGTIDFSGIKGSDGVDGSSGSAGTGGAGGAGLPSGTIGGSIVGGAGANGVGSQSDGVSSAASTNTSWRIGSNNGQVGGGGSGGNGGNGGAIILLYNSLTNTGSITVNAGTKGTKGTGGLLYGTAPATNGGDGNDGNNGFNGLIYYIKAY